MSTPDTMDEERLNAAAETWGSAVKAACAGEPSPATRARIRALAEQGLGTRRRRVFFARLRSYRVSAAAAALVCATTLLVIRPTERHVSAHSAHPHAALDGILMLAASNDAEVASYSADTRPTRAETVALARRLLEMQGFLDDDAEDIFAL